MKRLFLVFAIFISGVSCYAQHATVVYNAERNYFNENQPLPSETHFVLTGGLDADASRVVVDIFKANGKESRKPLHTSVWTRPTSGLQDVFSIPVNYMLRGKSEYDLKLTYYRNLTDAEREYLKVRMFQALDAYVNNATEVNKKDIRLLKPIRQIMSDLNVIVEDGLQVYENKSGLEFEGFSNVIKNSFEQIDDANLKQGKFLFGKKKNESKALYANQLLADVKKLIRNEAEQYMNSNLLTVNDVKYVDDYPTQKSKSSLSLNVGYGGVYIDGDFDDFNYGSAPYAGVSLPFGRKAFSRFLGNASLSLGVFLVNFDDQDDIEVTGPVIKRPFYVGLGYKLFKFVRLNAGAAFIEQNIAGNNDVKVRPFIGLSAEVNLSLSFGDK